MPDPTRLERLVQLARAREGLAVEPEERVRLLTQQINALYSKLRDYAFVISKGLRARRVEVEEDPKVPFAIAFSFLGSKLSLAMSPDGQPGAEGPGTPLLGVYRLEHGERELAAGRVHLHPQFLDAKEDERFVDEHGKPIDWDDIFELLIAPPPAA